MIEKLELYKDEALTEPFTEDDTLFFGECRAGDSKTLTLYVKNEKDTSILEAFEITNKKDFRGNDVTIDFPERVWFGEAEPINFTWSPSMTFDKALEVPVHIRGWRKFTVWAKGGRKKVE